MTTADRNGPSRHDKAVALLADHHHELSDFTKWPFVLFHKDGRRFTPLESFTVNFLPRDELLAVLAEALDRAAERRDAWERLAELAEPTIPEWRELTVAEVIARFPSSTRPRLPRSVPGFCPCSPARQTGKRTRHKPARNAPRDPPRWLGHPQQAPHPSEQSPRLPSCPPSRPPNGPPSPLSSSPSLL